MDIVEEEEFGDWYGGWCYKVVQGRRDKRRGNVGICWDWCGFVTLVVLFCAMKKCRQESGDEQGIGVVVGKQSCIRQKGSRVIARSREC